jgi:hypothetical protein
MARFSKARWPSDGPVRALLEYLDELHREAGQPSMRDIGKALAVAPATLHAHLTGVKLIGKGTLELLVQYLDGDTTKAERLRRKATVAWNDRPAPGEPEQTITIDGREASRQNHPAPRQLEPPPEPFVNRDEERTALHRLLGAPGRTSRRTVIVLSGPGGVGKTGLALRWAHEVRKHYPDGQILRNLSGYGPGPGDVPADPSDVLADWLSLLWDLKRSELPTSREGRRELFNAKMVGRRMILVLDNAASADQVRPLLPGTDACLVLVTSRNRMSGLMHEGAHGVELDVLHPDRAIELLRARIGDRIDVDPAAAAELARYCAYLPMALHTTATHLRNEPGQSVAAQAHRLSDEQHRLVRLGHPDDPETALDATSSLSYQRLSSPARRLFRLLALHPANGATAGVYSIARLAGHDPAETENLLSALVRESLISKVENRYRSRHDVLRLYAMKLLGQRKYATERRAAVGRLAHAYYGCVQHAFDRVNRDNPMVDAEFLADWRRDDPQGAASVDDAGTPAAWFADERLNLVALIRTIGRDLPPLPITPKLACSLFYFFETGGYLADWEEVEQIAADVATAHGDDRDEARSLRNRARILLVKILDAQERRRYADGTHITSAGAYDEAAAMLQNSRHLYRAAYTADGRLGDLAGEATVLRELADLRRLRADPGIPGSIEETIGTYQEAEHAYRALASANGLASLRLALGITYALNDSPDDLREAERYFRASLDYSSQPNETGAPQHPRLKGYALRHLGDLYRRRTDLPAAVSLYQESIVTFLEAGDAISAGRALVQCGLTLIEHRQRLDSGGHRLAAGKAHDQARASLLRAKSLLSAFPREVEGITDWLDHLGPVAEDGTAEGR